MKLQRHQLLLKGFLFFGLFGPIFLGMTQTIQADELGLVGEQEPELSEAVAQTFENDPTPDLTLENDSSGERRNPAANEKKSRTVYPKKTELDFEGAQIQGELKNPGEFYFQYKPEEKMD